MEGEVLEVEASILEVVATVVEGEVVVAAAVEVGFSKEKGKYFLLISSYKYHRMTFSIK